MSKSALKIAPALKPRETTIKPFITADYLWFKMHEAPTTPTDLVNSSGKVFTAAQTITGAVAGDWSSVATRLTPGAGSGGSTRNVRWHNDSDPVAAATAQAFFTPSPTGSHVFLWDHVQTRDAPSAEFLFAASPNFVTSGGYAIRLMATGLVQLALRAPGGGSLDAKAQYDLGTMPVSRTSIMAVFDWANGQSYIYTNGVQRHNAAIAAPYPTPDVANVTSGGINLFSNTGAGGSQHINNPTTGTQSGTSVSDMLIIKNTTNRAADFATLAMQHYQYERELPRILKDW